MKKTMFTLLAVAALALIGYCCYWWWKGDGLPKRIYSGLYKPVAEFIRQNRKIHRLKADLRLSDFRGPSERYVWKSPSSISISNRTFKISNMKNTPNWGTYSFNVGCEVEGKFKRVCNCWVYAPRHPETALYLMLNEMLGTYSIWPADRLDVELDEKGNVLVAEKIWNLRDMRDVYSGGTPKGDGMELVVNPTRFKRTYGNIYMEIRLEIGTKDVPCAKDFALPLLEAGASRRFSIFGR